MATLTRSELQTLMEPQSGPCISMFFPTYRADVEIHQNQLRLRNQIREVENRLYLSNLSSLLVARLLKPLHALLSVQEFWQHPSDGVAIFHSPNVLRFYTMPYRFKEQVVVTRHFYLKPLLPFLIIVGPYFLKTQQEAAAKYREYAETNRASHAIREIIPAAYYGRIESLFVAIDQEQWGTYDPVSTMLHVHKDARFGDDDLLDIAATQTLLHQGAVYAVEQTEMPDKTPVAAVFRY